MSVSSDFADSAMLELFRAEVDTHAQTLNEGLLALERDPARTEVIEGLMRAAHSIKGAARIVGVDPCVQLAHVMEDCLVAAQEGKVRLTPNDIDALLRGTDLIVQVARLTDSSLDAWMREHAPQLQRLVADIKAIKTKPTAAPTTVAEATPPAAAVTPAEPRLPQVRLAAFVPEGVFDADSAEKMRLAVVEAMVRNESALRFDLSQVTDVLPEGLALFAALDQLGDRFRVQFQPTPPSVQTLLRATQLQRLIG